MRHEKILIRDDATSFFETYLLDDTISNQKIKRPALIILPGGAYLYKSYREGELVATQFSAFGYQTFVFSYPTIWKKKYYEGEEIETNALAPYPEQVIDLYKTIALIRERADEFGIDPDQIYLMGFSAGGHVAAAGAVNWQNEDYLKRAGVKNSEDSKPNGVVLCYPMIDAELIRERSKGPIPKEYEREGKYIALSAFGTQEPTEEMYQEMYLIDKVNSQTPPFFIWHTFEDEVTPASQTTLFVEALLKNKIPCEYHLFATGHHGMSLCTPAVSAFENDYNYNNAIWPVLADLFLKRLGQN